MRQLSNPDTQVALSSYVGGGTVVGTVEAETLAQLVPNPKIPVYKIHMTVSFPSVPWVHPC